MTIKLHDSRLGKKVPFEPLSEGEVTMYLCGPTVYNLSLIHISEPTRQLASSRMPSSA